MRLYARPIDSYDILNLIEVVAKLPSEIINSHKSKPKIHFTTLLLFLFFQSDERALSLTPALATPLLPTATWQ